MQAAHQGELAIPLHRRVRLDSMPPTVTRRRRDLEPLDPSLRALVVEDDPNYRFYISTLARRFGFSVTGAADGEEALALLREPGSFDLLIVDCEMPRLGGLELIASIRTDDRHGEAYAVMITAREDVDTRISALQLGFDDYLPKSSSELEIAAKLSAFRRLVSRHRRLDSAVRELYGLANRDELTGLFNRRYFFAEAERQLAEGQVVNIVLFDLDDFKAINDEYGHLTGDRILHDLGGLFARRTRRADIIARYGGDEFVMLVAHLAPHEVESVAARLASDIATGEWSAGARTFRVGVTTGIACSSLLATATIHQLLSACDRDLYKNKWLRKHPDLDPSLYQYDESRDAKVLEMLEYRASDAASSRDA